MKASVSYIPVAIELIGLDATANESIGGCQYAPPKNVMRLAAATMEHRLVLTTDKGCGS